MKHTWSMEFFISAFSMPRAIFFFITSSYFSTFSLTAWSMAVAKLILTEADIAVLTASEMALLIAAGIMSLTAAVTAAVTAALTAALTESKMTCSILDTISRCTYQ